MKSGIEFIITKMYVDPKILINSLTAGVQSDGIVNDFQELSFLNLIAQQSEINDYEQPLIDSQRICFGQLGITSHSKLNSSNRK